MVPNPLTKYRKQKKLSQHELAKVLDCSPALVSHIERGRRAISAEKALEWEPLLDIPREQLCPDIFRRAA